LGWEGYLPRMLFLGHERKADAIAETLFLVSGKGSLNFFDIAMNHQDVSSSLYSKTAVVHLGGQEGPFGNPRSCSFCKKVVVSQISGNPSNPNQLLFIQNFQ